MTQVQEWSELYRIPKEHIATLHARDTSLGAAYNHLDLIKTILQTNSQLVLEFLASLPEPNLEDRFGIGIDFILPTEEAMGVMMASERYPSKVFAEKENGIATRYWDSHGTEFYFGPGEATERGTTLLLPTYVQTIGECSEGYRHLITQAAQEVLDCGFLIHYFKVGELVDQRERAVDLSHDNVGIGMTPLRYVAASNHYDSSSGMGYESLGMFWSEEDCAAIRDGVNALNQRFFRIENRS